MDVIKILRLGAGVGSAVIAFLLGIGAISAELAATILAILGIFTNTATTSSSAKK